MFPVIRLLILSLTKNGMLLSRFLKIVADLHNYFRDFVNVLSLQIFENIY